MKSAGKCVWAVCVAAVFVVFAGDVRGQGHGSSYIVVPQARPFSSAREAKIKVDAVKVGVVILEQAATTTMDISLSNPSGRRVEAELIVPVPDGAVLKSFTFQGAASEPTAKLLPKEEARKTYEAIVARIRDPALMEFVGYNLIRTSVFPVAPKGTQKVRLTYEQLLTADGPRIDYVIPRSESLEYNVPWDISVKIKSKKPVSTVYSPSHELVTTRSGANTVSVKITAKAGQEPGPFLLSYLVENKGVTASLFTYPDPKAGGGYFLLLAGLPAKISKDAKEKAIKREVTLVLDRSGSMNGEKIEQAREAALQVLAGLGDDETFNIITYSDTVDYFSKTPVIIPGRTRNVPAPISSG